MSRYKRAYQERFYLNHQCISCGKPLEEGRTKVTCVNCAQISIKNKRLVKKKIIEYFGGSCKDCGLKSPYSMVYDIHHEQKDLKDPALRSIRHMNILYSWAWGKIIKELEHCVLLCANCHRIRHATETLPE